MAHAWVIGSNIGSGCYLVPITNVTKIVESAADVSAKPIISTPLTYIMWDFALEQIFLHVYLLHSCLIV